MHRQTYATWPIVWLLVSCFGFSPPKIYILDIFIRKSLQEIQYKTECFLPEALWVKNQLWVRLEFQLLFFPKIHTILKPPVCTTGFSKAENHNGLKKVNRISLTQRHPSSLQTPWLTWAKKKKKKKRKGWHTGFFLPKKTRGRLGEFNPPPNPHNKKTPGMPVLTMSQRRGNVTSTTLINFFLPQLHWLRLSMNKKAFKSNSLIFSSFFHFLSIHFFCFSNYISKITKIIFFCLHSVLVTKRSLLTTRWQ